ncbi:H(+)-transporting two-sector ATPase [Stackebrandtia nassauensis DSM 44728]|uniref:H(+)-transporting two-sector ATPase n=1 Tax=Stackebrandtia nassauensis (strain DSM 44728 / CIP 108903 / NRRL B-16338 / NBRC 102104 / LLR-40K-21) TaxID=446470 RepID=D3PW58_STANL|nr:H(+)-transporting two-sector ATPase [Stackebrandtia nassauensis DSM 44728]
MRRRAQSTFVRPSLRHPARLVPLAFLGVAAVGTGLLSLPISREGSDAAEPITALFTAVSAVCVTGLVTVDTGTYWSGFGEVVIAALMQVGGFGIMTMASLLGLIVSGRMRLSDKLVTATETKMLGLGDVRKVVVRVALVAICVETVVAVILGLQFRFSYDYAPAKAAWYGIFHAVAAFNSGGFALYSDSLESFVTDPVVILPVTIASLVGGIGFPVVVELIRRTFKPSKWSIHTKITVLGTGVLLAAGFVFYLAIEWNNAKTLGPLDIQHKIQAAFFSAAMPRSAGFNAVPTGDLRPETWAVTDILMFIGGGSAGTAGGIKVATFFLLAFVIWAEVRGEPDVSVFGRRIPHSTQRQALTVALMGVAAVACGTIALLFASDAPFDQLLFEVTSAFGTAGLSTGLTGDLNNAGQIVIIVLMFAGRVGTVAVATALALRVRHRRFRFPEERPIVG